MALGFEDARLRRGRHYLGDDQVRRTASYRECASVGSHTAIRTRSGYGQVLVSACYLSLRRKGRAFLSKVLDMLLGPWLWRDSDSLQGGDQLRWQTCGVPLVLC